MLFSSTIPPTAAMKIVSPLLNPCATSVITTGFAAVAPVIAAVVGSVAVTVTEPLVPDSKSVVSSLLVGKNGPSEKVISVIDQFTSEVREILRGF